MTRKPVLTAVAITLLAAGTVSAQTEWVDHPDSPVLENGEPGEWDAGEIVVGAIAWDGSVYHMVYAGDGENPDDRYAVGHATSTDGVTWEKDPNNPVLTRGTDGEWDEFFVAAGPLIYDGSGFHMWYDGHDGDVDRTGYATSPDGSVWTKYPGNPVLDVGPTGSFDELGGWPMSVILSDGTYRMWYSGVDSPNRFWRIGYAESTDGISWTKHEDNPVLGPGRGWDSWDVWDPAVVFDGSMYHMWYSGSENGIPTGIGYAMSSDGIAWTKHRYNPVIPSDDRWASASPAMFDGSTFHIWYHRWDSDNPGDVIYATSVCCPGISALDRWKFIPAAAYAAGAEGSFYETDLDLSNAGSLDAEYRFSWLPRGTNNNNPVESEAFTLAAGRSVRYSNVLEEVFDLEPDAFGALIIKATTDNLCAMARIANTPQEPDAGSFGQAITAIEACDCTGRDVRRRLLFGTEHAEMRFNVGCLNASDKAARVNFELYRSDGTMLGTESVILMPWSNDQLNRIFDPYHPVTGYVDFWSDLPTGNVYCYGSVLDNVTSDPTTIPPQ